VTNAGKSRVSLDSFDIKLLNALQENNQRTSEELAGLVSLSPAACLRRVKRLRDTRVISAEFQWWLPRLSASE
jgi:Lrp/AsnC family leucine-responsive transcriptional regulator